MLLAQLLIGPDPTVVDDSTTLPATPFCRTPGCTGSLPMLAYDAHRSSKRLRVDDSWHP